VQCQQSAFQDAVNASIGSNEWKSGDETTAKLLQSVQGIRGSSEFDYFSESVRGK